MEACISPRAKAMSSKCEDMADFAKILASSTSSDLPISSRYADLVQFPILSREILNGGNKSRVKVDNQPSMEAQEGEKKMDVTKARNQADFFPSKADLADLKSDSLLNGKEADFLTPKVDLADLNSDSLPKDVKGADLDAKVEKKADFGPKSVKESEFGSIPSLNPKLDHLYIGNVKVNTNGDNSFVKSSLTSTRSSLRYIKPETINGNVFIRPTWEMALEGRKRWEHTAVGYFIGKKIPFMGIKAFVFSVWKGLKEVKATSNGFYFFKFDSDTHLLNVIESGPWMYSGQPLFLERWKEGMSLEKRIHKEVPIWVKFRNVPSEYWTTEGLSMVASAVGKPLYPDAFTSTMERIDYARVCVVVDIKDKLLDHVYMILPSANGEYNGTCKVDIEYEWKPAVCTSCSSFGHVEGTCPIAKKAVQRPKPKPIQIYVPKSEEESTWQMQRRPRNNGEPRVNMAKGKGAMSMNPTGHPHKEQNSTAVSPKKKEEIIDSNPFSLLESFDIDERMDEMEDHKESLQGPLHAAPSDHIDAT